MKHAMIFAGLLLLAGCSYQYVGIEHGSSPESGPNVLGFGDGTEETDWNLCGIGAAQQAPRWFLDAFVGWQCLSDEHELEGEDPRLVVRAGWKFNE